MYVVESIYVWLIFMYYEKYSVNDMDVCDCGVFCLFDKVCVIFKMNI